jgi:hypothetical protein
LGHHHWPMRHSFLNREEVSGARNLSGLAKQINPAIGWAGMYKHPLPPCAENVRSAAMRFGAGKHGVDRRAGVGNNGAALSSRPAQFGLGW